MSMIELDHTEFKLSAGHGSLEVSFWTDSDGFRQRRITVADYHYSYAGVLDRVYRLPLPVSSLSPGVDEYFEALEPVASHLKILSKVIDERIVEKGMRGDQLAFQARWKRQKARALLRAQMDVEMHSPVITAAEAS